ncbi:MAG TPA: hypothetical protein VF939_25180 [Puia sp.]
MESTIDKLERIFAELCIGSFPHEWDENHLSFLLMKRLRELFGSRRIHFNKWSKIVDWKSYKNRGKQERDFGDIALIVTIQFSTGEVLQGVACLEAKRDFQSGNFESMDLEQLNRIKANLPYAHLLLYTHQRQYLQLKFPNSETWPSYLWVSPLNTAIVKLGQLRPHDNSSVLRTSFPFAMFLSARIFWGLDLDFRDDILNDIINGMNKIIDPAYLGVINVFYDGQRPVQINLPEIWEEI